MDEDERREIYGKILDNVLLPEIVIIVKGILAVYKAEIYEEAQMQRAFGSPIKTMKSTELDMKEAFEKTVDLMMSVEAVHND